MNRFGFFGLALPAVLALPLAASAALLEGGWTSLSSDFSYSDLTMTSPGSYAVAPNAAGTSAGLPAGVNSIVSAVKALPSTYSLVNVGDSISFTGKFSVAFAYRSGNDYVTTIKPANTPLFYFGLLDGTGGYQTRTGTSGTRGIYQYNGNSGNYNGWYYGTGSRLIAADTVPAAIPSAAWPSDTYSFGLTIIKTADGVQVIQAMKELGTAYLDSSINLSAPAEFYASGYLTGGKTTFSSVGFYTGGSTYKTDFSFSNLDVTFTSAAMPEPAAMGLIPLAGLALARRRR